MLSRQVTLGWVLLGLVLSVGGGAQQVAMKPPMGWNSYDCFGAAVHEEEVRANARILAGQLQHCGWEYVVVDYCWSYPFIGAMDNPPQTEDFIPRIRMDKYGRQLPTLDRFPSAKGKKGFKPLADYVHGLGLKFGIHVMRGVLRQAVAENTPILGADVGAASIANRGSTCQWLNHMYGVDGNQPGAQAYYDSLFQQYASWGVDYVKVDDISRPYHAWEIEAIHKAIDKCGRPMVLSLSPGETPVAQAEHVKQYANMWRMSGDFWDKWSKLKHSFDLCEAWNEHRSPGHWPDADMLPLGRLRRRGPFGEESFSRFTEAEQRTLMTLWCIFRSPLMLGGDLQMLNRDLLKLLNNKEVLAVNQNSSNNRLVLREDPQVVWAADVPGTKDRYVALFNIGENKVTVSVTLEALGLEGSCAARDLWARQDKEAVAGTLSAEIPAHDAMLYRVSIQ